jgi:hypothetical protein
MALGAKKPLITLIPFMTSKTQLDPRVLAIDLRPKRFGYAVFEGPKRLLDWGVASYRPGGEEGATVARRRVANLVRLFLPSVIVVRKVQRNPARNSPGVQPILKAIRRDALARFIPICLIARPEVRKAFRGCPAKSKYEIACSIVQMFPDLLWKLPPNRKFYESEHPSMTIFDAVALGIAYWRSSGAEIPPPE